MVRPSVALVAVLVEDHGVGGPLAVLPDAFASHLVEVLKRDRVGPLGVDERIARRALLVVRDQRPPRFPFGEAPPDRFDSRPGDSLLGFAPLSTTSGSTSPSTTSGSFIGHQYTVGKAANRAWTYGYERGRIGVPFPNRSVAGRDRFLVADLGPE